MRTRHKSGRRSCLLEASAAHWGPLDLGSANGMCSATVSVEGKTVGMNRASSIQNIIEAGTTPLKEDHGMLATRPCNTAVRREPAAENQALDAVEDFAAGVEPVWPAASDEVQQPPDGSEKAESVCRLALARASWSKDQQARLSKYAILRSRNRSMSRCQMSPMRISRLPRSLPEADWASSGSLTTGSALRPVFPLEPAFGSKLCYA